jgi:hypothetical protein
MNWVVKSNINDSVHIGRIDSQGLREPPRFTEAIVGEPYSTTRSYTNYIKASPNSLFRSSLDVGKYQKILPAYPAIYDYYRSNRLILLNGAGLNDPAHWAYRLDQINSVLGPTKQVHFMLMVVKDADPDFYYALYQHWLGGKENDAIIVVGTKDNETIDWVNVMSWTDNYYFKVSLRDDLRELKLTDEQNVLVAIETNIANNFKKKNFKDFEYLASTVVPTTSQYVWGLVLGLLVSIGLVVFTHKNEMFGR